MLAEGIPGGFSALYDALGDLETLGVCRRGYFVEGLGGAQFALPGAVERLRAQRGRRGRRRRSCSPRPTRRSPTAPRCRGPSAPRARRARPQRVAGAYVVLAGAEPVLYVERGGTRPARRSPAPTTRASTAALEALADVVTGGRAKLQARRVERVDGEPVVGSPGSRCSSTPASARARAS